MRSSALFTSSSIFFFFCVLGPICVDAVVHRCRIVDSSVSLAPVSQMQSVEVRQYVGAWFDRVLRCSIVIPYYDISPVHVVTNVAGTMVNCVFTDEERVLRGTFFVFALRVGFEYGCHSNRTQSGALL